MTLPVAVFVAIVGCVLAVSANVTTSKMREDIDQERYKRIAAEEQLQKAIGTISQLKVQLTDSQQRLGAIEQVINQGKSQTSTLKTQLDTLSSEKAALVDQVNKLQKALTDAQTPQVPAAQQENLVPPATP